MLRKINAYKIQAYKEVLKFLLAEKKKVPKQNKLFGDRHDERCHSCITIEYIVK